MTDAATSPFDDIRRLITTMPGPDEAAVEAVRLRERQLTKPAGSLGRLCDRVLRLPFGADEQDLPATGDRLLDEIESAREQRNALRKVDDVDAVAVAENVRLHPRVPAMGLVAEMRPGLEQLLHSDDVGRHWSSPSGSASVEPCHPGSNPGHRYVSSTCGMRAPLAEAACSFKALGGA